MIEETPEEIEQRSALTIWFTFLAIIAVIIGSYYVIKGLEIPMWYLGIVISGIGYTIASLNLFTKEHRYTVFSLGMIIALISTGWATLVSGAPYAYRGVAFLGIALFVIVMVGIINKVGLIEWRNRAIVFIILLCIISIGITWGGVIAYRACHRGIGEQCDVKLVSCPNIEPCGAGLKCMDGICVPNTCGDNVCDPQEPVYCPKDCK